MNNVYFALDAFSNRFSSFLGTLQIVPCLWRRGMRTLSVSVVKCWKSFVLVAP
jgi:hypothetical protein